MSSLKKQDTTTAMIAGGAGEDGDFVQLRKIREQKKVIKDTQKSSESNGAKFEQLRMLSQAQSTQNAQTELQTRPSSTTSSESKLGRLRVQLFAAIDAGSMHDVVDTVGQMRSIGKLTSPDALEPETGRTCLHYALDNGKRDIAMHLIGSGNTDLLKYYHVINKSGMQGKNNALHTITVMKDMEMAKFFLQKVGDQNARSEVLHMETAVDIEGQRPRTFSCLHLAAFYGNVDFVRFYLTMGMAVNHVNAKKDTALLWAARWGYNDIVRVLLEKGADPDIENDKGSTALYWAVRYEHVETVKLLLLKGNANPDTERKLGLVSPIIVAAAYGNSDIVKLLLNHPKTNVNKRIRGGEMPIHHAAREGNLEVVEVLLDHKVDKDAQDELGDTALLLAASNGHVDIVQRLILAGANLTHRNQEGKDVWTYAVTNDSNELLETLVAYSMANDNNRGTGRSPLCLAAAEGRCDKIAFLLSLKLDPAAVDNEGNTFLHHAAMNNQHEVIKQFYKRAKIDSKNNRGNTPIHIACLRGHAETIDTLIDCKAKADVKNNKGETALHVAAQSRTITPITVKNLVDYTIKTHAWESVNARDNNGNNCLHVAGKYANPENLWEFRFVRFKEKDKDGLTPLHRAVRPGNSASLHRMLDIFESMQRDARINEQSYQKHETVLHLAADEGFCECVRRLIALGADITIADANGDTVLHRIVRKTATDQKNLQQHLEVFDIILENAVTWWCINQKLAFPDEDNKELLREYKRKAILVLMNEVHNKEALSVLSLSFKVGASEVISRLLMMRKVTMFKSETGEYYRFDITHVTPTTNNDIRGCCTSSKVSSNTSLSCVEWLITRNHKSRAAAILDLPPMKHMERYYSSMSAWSFALLLFFHVLYMSLFTWISVALLDKLRDDPDVLDGSHYLNILLYVVVPIEPTIIIIFTIISFVRYAYIGDYIRKSKLSKKTGFTAVLNILSTYMFMIFALLFAIFVIIWIGVFSARYQYQDYFLAFAICVGWILSIAFTRGIKPIHYFYRMLLQMILRDVLRFLVVYMFVVLAFGFAFHVLFQVSSAVVERYETPAGTLFLAFNLMIGMAEIFDDQFESDMSSVGRDVTYIKGYYLIYIILSTIVLLNLLIAMMNDSYSRILQEQQITWRLDSVRLGVDIETSVPFASVFSNVKIEQGTLGPETTGGSKGGERWYVDIPIEELEEYQRQEDKSSSDAETAAAALSKRLEDLETNGQTATERIGEQLKQMNEILSRLQSQDSRM